MSTKVLVFESDAAFASELRNELGKLGCTTQVVDDGNVGLQQAAADRPDLILLSIELPRMNGFSVCNKLKKDASLKDVPLIIMSSESSDETFEQHRKLRTRAEDYVHKPIAFDDLLNHIQTFVRLGPAQSEGQIVIDDEIALAAVEMEDEGTQIAKRPDFAKSRSHDVDPDVDAFADAAFGMLQGSHAEPAPPAPPPPAALAPESTTRDIGLGNTGANPPANGLARDLNGGRVSEPPRPGGTLQGVPAPATGSFQAPSVPKMSSVPPRPMVDTAELDRVRGDLEKAKTRSAELEKELQSARENASRLEQDAERAARSDDEAKRMQRDIDELKAKLATTQRTSINPGVSSREFLDLREALNKKDKEILSLKEQLGKKDKEILDASDKGLVLERANAELDDKVIAFERELEDAKERIESLSADKDQAKKVGEDFKARLGRAQGDLEARLKELGDLRAKMQEEVAAREAAIAALKSDMQQAIEREQAEKASAAAEAEERRIGEAEASKKALEDAKEYAARERSDAVLARERELRQETDQKLAALHRAHQDELNRTRAEFGRQTEAANAKTASELAAAEARRVEQLEAAAQAANEKLAQREAELDARRASEIDTLTRERDERIAAMERDEAARGDAMANEHIAKVEALEADRDERIARLKRESEERVSALENDRDARVAAAEAKLAREAAEIRAVAEAEKAASGEQIALLERTLADTKQELVEAGDARAAADAANAARVQDLEQHLAQTTSARDELQRMLADTQRHLGEARDRITAMEAEIASFRADLDDTRRKLDTESSRATRAFAKWESDRMSLDRAKDALAVALQQIEDAEGRALAD